MVVPSPTSRTLALSFARSRTRNRAFALLAALGVIWPLVFFAAANPERVLAHSTTHFSVADFPSPTVAGVAHNVTVKALDTSDQPDPTYDGTVTLTSSDGQAVLPSPGTLTNGAGTFSVELRTAGPQSITATDGSITGSQSGITVTPGAADPDHTTISASATSVTVDPPSPTVTVRAKDQYDNNLTTGGDTVILRQLVDGVAGGPLSVSDHGDGTYTAAVADTHPRNHSISGRINGDPITTGNPVIGFTVGALASIVVTPDSSNINADTGFQTYTVEGFDQFGNSRGDATEATDFQITSGGSCTDNSCGSRTASSYTVTANDSDFEDLAALVITHGAPTKLAITTQPGSTYTADENHITVTVKIEDQWGNVNVDDNTSTIGLGLSGGDLTAVLGGAAPITVTNGVATFSNLTVRKVGTAYQLNATSTPAYTPASTNGFDITPGVLASFTIDNITTPQVAGVPIPLTSHAFDAWGNLKTNYTGSPTGHLATNFGISPSGTGPTVPAGLSWSLGIGTGSVTPFAAQTLRSVTVSDTSPSVSLTSNTFTVNPNNAFTTVFSATGFNGQPLDTKIATPIYSVCVPSGGTAPCALSPSSTGVRVLVRDQWGNTVLPTLITLGVGASTTGLGTATTSNGIADFGNQPSIAAISSPTLRAHAPTGSDGISASFQIAVDVSGCDNTLCKNTAIGNLQKGYDQITTSGDFYNGTTTNVLLRTQFLGTSSFPTGAQSSTNGCGPSTLVNQGQEALPKGAGVQATAPTTTMLIVISKDYLKQKGLYLKNPFQFSLCVGATWIGAGPAPANGWIGHDPKLRPVVTHADVNGVYWALANDCFVFLPNTSNPCIAVRTRFAFDVQKYFHWTAAQTAAYMQDGDLAFIVKKNSPWDGKGGVYS